MSDEDSIELASNGHVIVVIDGMEYDCRRPKAKEYQALSEAAITMQDKIVKSLPKGTEANDFTLKQQFTSNEVAIDEAGKWFLELLKTLSNNAFNGAEEDLPSWVISDISSQILQHWVAVPLVLPGR